MNAATQAGPAEMLGASNVGKSQGLKDDPALKSFLSKEIKNHSPVFRDYPPTKALVRAAIVDVMGTLGIRK